MNNTIVFDGDQTLNELVDQLVEMRGDEDEDIKGICMLEGENFGYELEVIIRRVDNAH